MTMEDDVGKHDLSIWTEKNGKEMFLSTARILLRTRFH